jgi:hypothetical protein
MTFNSTDNIYKVMFGFGETQNQTAMYWTPGKCAMVLAPEVVALITLAVAAYVMYRGVDISHPVYAILFSNLVFPFCTSGAIVTVSFVLDVNTWKIVSSVANMISMMYHHTCWAVLSGIRYMLVQFRASI